MRILIIAVICLLITTAGRAETNQQSINTKNEIEEKYITPAVKLMNAGDYDKAKQLVGQALTQEPNNARNIFVLGVIEFQSGDMNNALQKFQQAENIGNLTDEVLLELYNYCSIIYLKQKQIDKGIEYGFKSLKVNDSNNETAYVNLSTAYVLKEDSRNAIYYGEKVLKLDPENTTIMMSLGGVYFKLGDKEKARDYIQKAKEVLIRQGNKQGADMMDTVLNSLK